MKHKTSLLVTCILILFVAHQAQVGAETLAKTPVLSPLEAPFSPPDTVSVTYYQLNPGGSRLEVGGNPVECVPKKNNNRGDTSYGCTERNVPGSWYYPYPSNPYSDPIEDDYLPNVLAREMPAFTYPNPEAQKALAVAARTFAYYKGYLLRNTYNFDNSTQFQVDVPYAFNAYLNPLPPPLLRQPRRRPRRPRPRKAICAI